MHGLHRRLQQEEPQPEKAAADKPVKAKKESSRGSTSKKAKTAAAR